jgi:hypothetical protein
MSRYSNRHQPSQQDLMDAEAAGFAAATGRSNSKARESYIRNWGSTEILESYSKGFEQGFAQNHAISEGDSMH